MGALNELPLELLRQAGVSHRRFLHLEAPPQDLIDYLQHEIIGPNEEVILDEFYQTLLAHADSKGFLQGHGTLERLRQSQATHLQSMGVDVASEAYIDRRLHIGLVHARAGISLSLYIAATYHLSRAMRLAFALNARAANDAVFHARIDDLWTRLMAYDTALVSEAYHQYFVSGLTHSISGMRDSQKALAATAQTDGLTGVWRREKVLEYLEEQLAAGSQVAVLMIDLDYFKRVNDTYGHLVGDRVLRQTAQRIQHGLRSNDILGRYGGEEFMAVLPAVNESAALGAAERMRARISDSPMEMGGTQGNITISVGVALAKAGNDATEVMARADDALYQAKANGRNRVELAASH